MLKPYSHISTISKLDTFRKGISDTLHQNLLYTYLHINLLHAAIVFQWQINIANTITDSEVGPTRQGQKNIKHLRELVLKLFPSEAIYAVLITMLITCSHLLIPLYIAQKQISRNQVITYSNFSEVRLEIFGITDIRLYPKYLKNKK